MLNSYWNEILSPPSVECLDFGDEYDDGGRLETSMMATSQAFVIFLIMYNEH